MKKSPSKYFKKFLTSEATLNQRYRASARKMAFRGSGGAAAKNWQSKARRRLAERLGLPLFKKCPPRPTKVSTAVVDGLIREEWRIQTEKDVWMPYYLFIPPQARGKRVPLVLCPHGHCSAGKWAPGGRRDIPAMRDVIRQYKYDYGLQIARLGFITACPDARGFGQRREPAVQNDRQTPANLYTSSCHFLSVAGAPLGLSVQGMWTWDLMRLLDHLTRDPRVDPRRIGCAGLSGGGLQTLDAAAMDTRIKAAVVSGYFYGVRESLLVLNNNCMCNMVPGLWNDFDMGDIGALIAPRGLFVETGDRDPLNGASNLANVRSQVAISRKAFQALGSNGQLRHYIFHGEHRWDGTRSIPWLREQLGGK
jgi:hypothetical protein